MPEAALLIADPNSMRRSNVLRRYQEATSKAPSSAATLSEVYRLMERDMPTVIAVAAEMAALRDFAPLADVAQMIGARVIVYGTGALDHDSAAERVPHEDALIEMLTGSRQTSPAPSKPLKIAPAAVAAMARSEQAVRHIICLGASTGGVSALEAVLQSFDASCPPTVVVQHIRPVFAEGLIRRLDQALSPRVVAATDGAPLVRGTVYVAAAPDQHVGISSRGGLRLRLLSLDPVSGHRPSVDVLFHEAAAVAPRVQVSAALLTGMGADGADGMVALRSAGARTVAQDQQTSVVWGMPRVAVERGGAQQVLPLDQIARALLRDDAVGGQAT
ncbi:two-component system, chemotaxis family, response regulator CheB [Paracoccus tibetensis]|uniref:protein-glutamate methylesterase n=1 Tax=Paracoccus tibetensis TaxID=336292 RepID=A0A1G5IZW6_9RHOB|nr:two-component system, chemotaxis family, response regulator CheB [Paracoccus tibetensis]